MIHSFLLVLWGISLFFTPNPNQWLQGTWKGIGFQPTSANSGSYWTMEIEANVEKNEYLVRYPSIPCSGKWVLEKTRKESAIFKEIITEKDRCVDGGKAILTYVDDTHISYTMLRDNDTRVGSYATLTKQP